MSVDLSLWGAFGLTVVAPGVVVLALALLDALRKGVGSGLSLLAGLALVAFIGAVMGGLAGLP